MKNTKKEIVGYYDNLSYQGKFRIIFNLLFVGVCLLVGFISIIYSNLLSNEIYEKHQEKLTYLSQKIEYEFNLIESLTTEIHQSTPIQNSLAESNIQDVSSREYEIARKNGSKELTWLLADKTNATKALLLNEQGRNLTSSVYDSQLFFGSLSLEDVLKTLPDDSNKGKWFFSKDLSQALFIQNIFNTKQMKLKRVGVLLVFVNTSFIQQTIEYEDYFQDKDFYFLEHNGEYLSSEKEDFSMNIRAVKKSTTAANGARFRFTTTKNGRYFVYPRQIQTNTSEFTIYYFLLNNQVIRKVIKTMLIFGIILVTFLGGCYLLTNWYLRRLINPINELVVAMQRFKGEADLQNLQNLQTFRQSGKFTERSDEIGVLYESFQNLISEIQNLVIKDYQAKLLASEMEFKFLQAQLDPHFLYNTLNSINWLAINKEDWDVSEMVTALSKLLRKKIDNTNVRVKVLEELELIRAYIKIQSVRYDERLIFEESVDATLLEAKIPQLIIQPFVENAIKYAVERLDRAVTIKLNIYRNEEKLIIRVSDNGPGFDQNFGKYENSTGLGIENIKNRLRMLYGQQYRFSIESVANEKTVIIMELPLIFV